MTRASSPLHFPCQSKSGESVLAKIASQHTPTPRTPRKNIRAAIFAAISFADQCARIGSTAIPLIISVMRLSVPAPTDPTDRPTDPTGSDLSRHQNLATDCPDLRPFPRRSSPHPRADRSSPQTSDHFPADQRHNPANPSVSAPTVQPILAAVLAADCPVPLPALHSCACFSV